MTGLAVIPLLATVWTYWNHEPADHLRRMSSPPSVFTVGNWLPQWYERLHGDELIARAGELGVDTVYCHFFKGFGLRHERAEMLRTKDFVRKAHARGVKVLGYCQLNSLYYEAMLEEVPDLENWVARRRDGGIVTYSDCYYRWAPCIESREFVDYLKKAIRFGIEEVGLDGFHFDNSYVRDCYCARCQRAFRDWLAANVANPRETCGLDNFRHVRIPPMLATDVAGQELHDSFMIWRQKFRHARLAAFHKEVFDYVKSFGPDKLVLHNPAFGRNDFELRGLDVALEPSSCDFMMAENPRFIRAEADGRLVTQTAAYKLGRRFGFKVFDSTWLKVTDVEGTNPHTAIPRDADSVARFYAQGMIYGDIVGCPWLVRSTKRGDAVILDDPLQAKTAARAFRFFRENEERLFATTPVAKARVLYATDTFYGWHYEASGFHSFVGACERLNAEAIPYTIATEADVAGMGPGELLVVPDVRYLARGLYDALAAAGARGVKILPLGLAGLYDENGKERAADDPVRGLSLVANRVDDVPPTYRVEVSERGIMAETQVNARGERVLHLLRPGNASTIGVLRIVLEHDRAADRAEVFSFEDGCALAGVRCDDAGRTVLSVRNFRTMCSIVFPCQSKEKGTP